MKSAKAYPAVFMEKLAAKELNTKKLICKRRFKKLSHLHKISRRLFNNSQKQPASYRKRFIGKESIIGVTSKNGNYEEAIKHVKEFIKT